MTDVKQETIDHIKKVATYLSAIADELYVRADKHDASKLVEPELSGFQGISDATRGLKYGSMAYRAAAEPYKPTIHHHHKLNDHHPQFFGAGIDGMNLMQLVEMVCDWKAAGEREEGGNFRESLQVNAGRFEIEPQLENIIRNTAKFFGWME